MQLLDILEGLRISPLEQLKKGPVTGSGPAFIEALGRCIYPATKPNRVLIYQNPHCNGCGCINQLCNPWNNYIVISQLEKYVVPDDNEQLSLADLFPIGILGDTRN